MKTPIKLAILDDHKNQLEGLQAILSKEEDIEIVVFSDKWENFKPQILPIEIDIAILDIHLGDRDEIEDGLEIAEFLQDKKPEMKCIILSFSATYEEIQRAKQANVAGYLLKEESTKELLKAIRSIQTENTTYFSHKVTNILFEEEKKREKEIQFTSREIEVLKFISRGHNVPQIVKLSKRSDAVIKTHKKNVMKKLEIKNVEALVAWGIAHGYHKL